MLFKLHAARACACLSDAPSLGLCLIPQPYICTCLSFTLWTSQGWKWNDFQQGSCRELASVCILRPLYCTHPKPRAPTPSARSYGLPTCSVHVTGLNLPGHTFCHHSLMLLLPAVLFLYILDHTNSKPNVSLLMQNVFFYTMQPIKVT